MKMEFFLCIQVHRFPEWVYTPVGPGFRIPSGLLFQLTQSMGWTRGAQDTQRQLGGCRAGWSPS